MFLVKCFSEVLKIRNDLIISGKKNNNNSKQTNNFDNFSVSVTTAISLSSQLAKSGSALAIYYRLQLTQ